jgi:hypothetical protein
VERELPSRERNLYQIMRGTVFRIQVMSLPYPDKSGYGKDKKW